MDYKPGDVANGHVLGADGQWHPVGSVPSGQQYLRLDPSGYWARYLRRWRWTALAFLVLFMTPLLAGGDPVMTVVGGGLMFACGGVFLATVVNLVVAMFPSRVPTGKPR